MTDIDPEELSSLTRQLERLGCPKPKAAAMSQLTENINQLASASLLNWIWQECIIDENSWRWIESSTSRPFDEKIVGAQLGSGLREMLAKNVSKEAIIDVVRYMQFEAICSLLSYLEGSAAHELPVEMSIYEENEIDGEFQPIRMVNAYDSILVYEPSGRELRPRPRDGSTDSSGRR